ncbi:MAG: lanthionine synthetase, partial [Bradyrhizobium sp.]|nr:lanthionine synthetase [Bradyrhizobium sp.]
MFDPKRHIALTPEPWDEAAARTEIEAIVADAVARFDAKAFWPAHPSDDGAP